MDDHRTQLERTSAKVYASADLENTEITDVIEGLIRDRNEPYYSTVLKLAPGSAPVRFYREHIRRDRDKVLCFEQVVKFN